MKNKQGAVVYPPTTDQLYMAAVHIIRMTRDGYTLTPIDYAHGVPLTNATAKDYEWTRFATFDALAALQDKGHSTTCVEAHPGKAHRDFLDPGWASR